MLQRRLNMAREQSRDVDPFRIHSPRIYLVRMTVFLILAGFVVFILNRPISVAFMANPALNSLIIGVLLMGALLTYRQIIRLFPEVGWANGLRHRDPDVAMQHVPVLLAPMAMLVGERPGMQAISTATFRAIIDSIGTRL